MDHPRKEIIIGAKKEGGATVPGTGEKVILYQLPLEHACRVFDIISRHFGMTLLNIGVKFSLRQGIKAKGADKVNIQFTASELRSAVRDYTDKLELGDTYEIFKIVILPAYTKASGEDIKLEAFYRKHGFSGMLELLLQIIRYNFSDFLSSA